MFGINHRLPTTQEGVAASPARIFASAFVEIFLRMNALQSASHVRVRRRVPEDQGTCCYKPSWRCDHALVVPLPPFWCGGDSCPIFRSRAISTPHKYCHHFQHHGRQHSRPNSP